MIQQKFRRLLRKSFQKLKGTKSLLDDPAVTLRERFPEHSFGRGTYGDLTVRQWGEGARLSIGNFCSIAAGVQIFLGGEHRPDWVTTYPFNVLWPQSQRYTGHPKSKGDVVIGHDVWIGAEAVILSGVTIGNGAVIGARAVVAKSIAPYTIVTGNPARISRMRFNENTIAELEATEWWDWPDDIILSAMPDLLSADLTTFLERAKSSYYIDLAQAQN
ncbi:MAG: hypothetical protein CML23_04210 [Rhizobiaceae bacterium]|nr:hypothetical protein [Rhizobiaceae bacterium]